MTDIVERLREYVESTDYINAEPLCAEAADRIAELEQQLARQRLQLEDYALSNIQDRQELAAAQAREKVHIETLKKIALRPWPQDSNSEATCLACDWVGRHDQLAGYEP